MREYPLSKLELLELGKPLFLDNRREEEEPRYKYCLTEPVPPYRPAVMYLERKSL